MRKHIGLGCLVLVVLLADGTEAARNFQLKGKNEISGGFGFQASFRTWTPGGFKWFNEYNRELGRITWLNVQLNFVLGGEYGYGGGWGTCIDNRGRPYKCWAGGWSGFSGWAVEAAIGAKLKWRLQRVPLQFHAKFGGIVAPIMLGGNANGVALGYRGGFGVRYFVVPTLGVGAEFMHDLGPSYVANTCGLNENCWHFYATLDFNVGVEWRF